MSIAQKLKVVFMSSCPARSAQLCPGMWYAVDGMYSGNGWVNLKYAAARQIHTRSYGYECHNVTLTFERICFLRSSKRTRSLKCYCDIARLPQVHLLYFRSDKFLHCKK